jgi:Transglycosylase SLT domain
MNDGNWAKRLRPIGVAAALLVAPAAIAQNKETGDHLRRIVARSEAKHLRSRQNLFKILREYPQFWLELQTVAERLKTQPAWLLNVMAVESLFDPSARNSLPGQSASGLLQFVNETASRLGTTTAAIREMGPVDQLRLVEKYFAPFRGRLNSMADVYMAVFRGFIIEGRDETVISPLNNSRKEQRIYWLNEWLDLDNDRKITRGELALAATLIGRFQPQNPTSLRPCTDLRPTLLAPLAPPDRKPLTRSIYIRSPKPIE